MMGILFSCKYTTVRCYSATSCWSFRKRWRNSPPLRWARSSTYSIPLRLLAMLSAKRDRLKFSTRELNPYPSRDTMLVSFKHSVLIWSMGSIRSVWRSSTFNSLVCVMLRVFAWSLPSRGSIATSSRIYASLPRIIPRAHRGMELVFRSNRVTCNSPVVWSTRCSNVSADSTWVAKGLGYLFKYASDTVFHE